MKKINKIESVVEIISYMEKYNLTFNLYSNYGKSGVYYDPCNIYYNDETGWHYYITEYAKRTSEIYNLTYKEISDIIFKNLMQINSRYWDRKYYIFPKNYINHLTGKIKAV